MTTANLSVGIKTSKAKEQMQSLLADLKASLKGVKLEFNAESLKASLQQVSSTAIKLTIDQQALTSSVNAALKASFAQSYSISINTAGLTEQVRAAVQAGMTGVQVKSTGGGAVAPVPGVASAIQNDNNKLIVQVGQAFSDALGVQVDKAAQKLRGEISKGPLQASARFSAVDPESGARFSATQRLPDPQQALSAIQNQLAGVEALKMRMEAEARRAAQTALEARKQADADAAWSLRSKPVDKSAAFAAAEAQRGTEAAETRAKLEQGLAEQQAKRRLALEKQTESEISAYAEAELRKRVQGQEAIRRAQTNNALRNAQVEATQAAEAARKQAEIDAAWSLRSKPVDKSAAFAAAEAQRGTEAAESKSKLEQDLLKQQIKERLALEKQTESEITRYFEAELRKRVQLQEAALRAQNANAQRAAKDAWNFGPDRSTLLALRDQANNAGAQDAAKFGPDRNTLLALRDRYNKEQAEAQARAQKGLKEAGDEVDNHTRKVKVNTDAHSAWRNAMNDVHSGARGLAGSLGLLWTTWGNTAPIVAMAALGATMRSVFTVGKDLGYQLTFVSALTDNSAVSMTKFGDAVRMGAMVAPVEAAQAMRGLAQNGLGVRDSLQALPAILQLATVGEMSLADAALGATGVMAAFNLQVGDLPRIVDVFAKAAAMSNTSVSQMTEAMKQASTVSDQYGVSLEDTAATLAVMAKRNITGSAAGTAFRNMMVELATPTEKAKKAFASLGVTLYDQSGQLKEYGSILEELRNKTVMLNEKSRLNFLNDIFGERGGKAINSLLSDYKLFQETQRQLKEESKDFASTVSRALESETEGKVKAMMAEFQLSTSSAFKAVNLEVNHFIDSLRQLFASTGFQEGITSAAKALTELTNFLSENGKAVAETIAIWAGFRVVGSAVAGITALRTALAAAAVAGETAAFAMRAFWGAATGGVAIIAALAFEFLNYRNNTTAAEEAQRRLGTELDLLNGKLERELEALRENNKVLDRRNELLREGKSRAEADKIIDSETSSKKSSTMGQEVAQAQRLLNEARAKRQALVDEQEKYLSVSAYSGAEPLNAGLISNLDRQIQLYEDNLRKAQNAKATFDSKTFESGLGAWKSEQQRRLSAVKEFNDQLAEIAAQGKKVKTSDLGIATFEALYGDEKTFDAFLKARKAKLNERLGSYTKPDSEKRHEDNVEVRNLLSQMNREREELQMKLDLQAKLERAEFPERVIGAETAAYMAQQRALSGVIQLKEMEQRWNTRIAETIKNSRNLTPADKSQLTEALARNDLSIKKADATVQNEAKIRNANLVNQENRVADERRNTLEKLRDDVFQIEREMDLSHSKRVQNPEDVVRQAATSKVQEKFASDIRKALQDQEDVQRSLNALRDRASKLQGKEKDDAEDIVLLEEKRLQSARDYVEQLQRQRDLSITRTGQKAVDNFRYENSAEGGWDRYWKEYRDAGKSSAEYVYQAMKKSTDLMGNAIEQFVMTGKINFRSLIVSFLQEQAKLSASNLFSRLLRFVGSQFGSPSGAADANTMPGLFANGGVMTSSGVMPLRKYSMGGVASSPQLAIYGEGRKPEAYVPLPDGRTIPVTMSQQQAPKSPPTIILSPNISIDSRTDRADVQRIVDGSLKQYHEMTMAQFKELGVV